MVAGRDHVRSHVEELFCNGRRNSEAACGIFSVNHQKIDGIAFKYVRQMFAYDVAAGRAKDIADKKNIHSKSLHWLPYAAAAHSTADAVSRVVVVF